MVKEKIIDFDIYMDGEILTTIDLNSVKMVEMYSSDYTKVYTKDDVYLCDDSINQWFKTLNGKELECYYYGYDTGEIIPFIYDDKKYYSSEVIDYLVYNPVIEILK